MPAAGVLRRLPGGESRDGGAAGRVRVRTFAIPNRWARVARELAKKRGWSAHVAEGTVLGHWPSVVGQQIADHATPTALNDGVLSVAAESTAWATQLRMIQAQVLAKIAAAVGNGVVTSLKITGPAAPSWRKGPRHISGRGPRDTYG